MSRAASSAPWDSPGRPWRFGNPGRRTGLRDRHRAQHARRRRRVQSPPRAPSTLHASSPHHGGPTRGSGRSQPPAARRLCHGLLPSRAPVEVSGCAIGNRAQHAGAARRRSQSISDWAMATAGGTGFAEESEHAIGLAAFAENQRLAATGTRRTTTPHASTRSTYQPSIHAQRIQAGPARRARPLRDTRDRMFPARHRSDARAVRNRSGDDNHRLVPHRAPDPASCWTKWLLARHGTIRPAPPQCSQHPRAPRAYVQTPQPGHFQLMAATAPAASRCGVPAVGR